MPELRKISVKKLFALQSFEFESYFNTLSHLVAKSSIGKANATELELLTFGQVINIRQVMADPDAEGLIEVFMTVFGLSRKQVLCADVVSFYHALNWIKEQVIELNKRESSNLSSTPDEDLKSAGIEQLNVFGELNTLIALGEKFGVPPQEVEKWTYSFVFSLVYHDKITHDINKRHSKIISRKK